MLYSIICASLVLFAGLFISYREAKLGILDNSLFKTMLGGLACIVGLIALVILSIVSIEYQGSKYKADIINREYGTNYSQQEIFYGSSVVNIIRELDRKRYEINGDFRRQRDPERNLPKPDNR